MGIRSNTANANITYVRYSAFLGMLYVSTPANEKLIDEAKSLAGGEAEVKKGFAGTRGDTSSAKARAFLANQGVDGIAIDGILINAYVAPVEINGGSKTPYLSMTLEDDHRRYRVSVNLEQPGAQMLARKLTNATPGVQTTLNMFATYDLKEGASRAYANHAASLRQDGTEVKGEDPRVQLIPRVEAALIALQAAGVNDKKTLRARNDQVELDYHVEVMKSVERMFKAYYDAAEQAHEQAA